MRPAGHHQLPSSSTQALFPPPLRPNPTHTPHRRYETVRMTAADHRESAAINTSLMALKDCFRAYHYTATGVASSPEESKGIKAAAAKATPARTRSEKSSASFKRSLHDPLAKAPYRACALTRVLRECFEEGTGQSSIAVMSVWGRDRTRALLPHAGRGITPPERAVADEPPPTQCTAAVCLRPRPTFSTRSTHSTTSPS